MKAAEVDLGSLPDDGGEKYNRLVFEKSPYLLLHAENPIDWYPWSEEALEKARHEDKPVFLSIGYSACHWCHVMEGESFADREVAALLNRHFVSVKVDREERPDIDQIYMTACQVMTGRGGWPLTAILTPQGEPFFAGTYIPRRASQGRGGLVELLERAARVWKESKALVLESAASATRAVAEAAAGDPGEKPGLDILHDAFAGIAASYDEGYGGFGDPPKFPTPHRYRFLLRYAARFGSGKAVKMTDRSLRALRRGGIFDHVGFGFHRYSTDRKFLVPHFEKMLYDQALLAEAYLEAYQVTGEGSFAETAREIFTYVLRDMQSREGGFHSAEDADSDGGEGSFYLWSRREILSVLGSARGSAWADRFGVAEEGNYVDEASGKATGMNILHLTGEPVRKGEEDASRVILFRHRRQRERPLKDDKIITSWNGLMIGALALGGVVLGEGRYIAAAEEAADFVLKRMVDEKGRLFRRYCRGQTAYQGYLEDYAFMVSGLLGLYEATFHVKYLAEACRLNGAMMELFRDERGGGFFFSGKGNERLISSVKESHDGALPSGNSVAVLNLLRLARMTGDMSLEETAESIVSGFAGDLRRSPHGHTMMLTALDFLHGPTREIVIAGKRNAADTKAMIGEVRRRFFPNQVVLLKTPDPDGERLSALAPYTRDMSMSSGKATAYICRDFACRLPVTDPELLRRSLL